MSLRNRLWLVVGSLVLLPLLVGGMTAVVLVRDSGDRATRRLLQADAAGIDAALSAACTQAGIAARSLAAEAAVTGPAPASRALVAAGHAELAAVTDASGTVLARAGDVGVPLDRLGSCTARQVPASGGALVAERVRVVGAGRLGTGHAVVARRFSLGEVLEASAGGSSVVLLLAPDGRVVDSTGGPRDTAALATVAHRHGTGEVTAGAWLGTVRMGDAEGRNPYTVMVAARRADAAELAVFLAALVLGVAVLVLALGWGLARQLTGPLSELTRAAERVAEGDLTQTMPVRRRDEMGRLATAFNHMTGELRLSMADVSRSRDDLRESLARLGGALGSTHDLDGLLSVVLDTALTVSGAQAGAAWVDEGDGSLQLVTTKGRRPDLPDRFVEGSGADLLIQASATGEIVYDDRRLIVPLMRLGRVVGLLGLGSDDGPPRVDAAAESALRTLAAQAGIAVDNVLVHREAQRLSITDPLTGLWNFRYLSINLAREVERASRFGRPLAVLMMDLDHFKVVNDTYGHARGDAVLREIASRLSEQVREIDTLARYGGEEFVLVLPETTSEGAVRLAERICAAVRREPFPGDGDGDGDGGGGGEAVLAVTVSLGVACFPQHGASAATLMRAADEALYVAKREGRDRWVLAGVRQGAGGSH